MPHTSPVAERIAEEFASRPCCCDDMIQRFRLLYKEAAYSWQCQKHGTVSVDTRQSQPVVPHLHSAKDVIVSLPKIEPFPAHGINCVKVLHRKGVAYEHMDSDDTPYNVDGVMYCGRCHVALPSPFARDAPDLNPDSENYVGHNEARRLGAPCICPPGERHIMCPYHGR